MRRLLWLGCTPALLLLGPMLANASHQPPADAGEMPVTFVYAKGGPDVHVRTSIVVTGGAGPAVHRLAYGTAEGVLHLQTLDRGSPVGSGDRDPELGLDLDEGPVNDTTTFGQGTGTITPVDTSTEERLGHLLVLHNDNGAVHLAQIDLVSGELVSAVQAIDQSLGCVANSSPVVMPPDDAGDRLVFFTMTGSACRRAGLLRARLTRAATREAQLSPPELMPVADLNPTAAPAVVYLENGEGAVRPFVAVAALTRILLYPAAGDPAAAPAMTIPMPDGETPQTPATPVTGPGLPPGAPGSGAAKAPAVYVAAALAAGGTRVHKLVQRGREQTLTFARSTGTLEGVPAPELAVGEIADDAATRPNGRLLVTTDAAAHVLETAEFGVVGSLKTQPGFSRTGARISGSYAYLLRDSGEPIVLRTGDASRVGRAEFTPNAAQIAGDAYGAPTVSRGFVIWGGAGGAFAYRNRDVTPPFVQLTAPDEDSVLAGAVTFSAVAGDLRGVKQVDFRLLSRARRPRVVARAASPESGSPFLLEGARYSAAVPVKSLTDGLYVADAVATDVNGNWSVSGRRTVRVTGTGKGRSSRRGRCANVLRGAGGNDQLMGSKAGDRILGSGGDDELDGAGGHDCVSGHAGADAVAGGRGHDRLRGGAGADLVRGGAGRDRLHAGGGVNRLSAGAGADYVNAVNGRRDRVSCGSGRDRARVDRRDRMRGCERVRRVRRPRS